MDFSEAELEDLYSRYAHVLYHRCFRILKNEEAARDAVQETFAKVMRSSTTFRAQSSPLTWMYTISTNYCLNQLRNRKTRQGKLTTHREDIAGPAFTEPKTGERDRERVLELLEASDEQTRRVVLHTFFDECTREETARLVGISVPTVRKRLNGFLDHARRQLGALALTSLCLIVLWSTP